MLFAGRPVIPHAGNLDENGEIYDELDNMNYGDRDGDYEDYDSGEQLSPYPYHTMHRGSDMTAPGGSDMEPD